MVLQMTPVPTMHRKSARLFFFWSGIAATFAYRIIVVLQNIDGPWAKIAWYVGTIGFVVYFIHRYQISETRARLISERQLRQKVTEVQNLSVEDRSAMEYVFATLVSSREKWNYVAIFVMSGIALALGVYLDFFAR